jgi:nucleoside-diphosphate-sugar epimerase
MKKKLHVKITILLIGKGYFSSYILKAAKKNFNVKLITRKELLAKKKINSIDMIFHTIGINRFESAKEPKKSFLVKKKYTNKIIDFAKKNKIKKIIYLSSSLVYHKQFIGKFNENSKLRNNEPYAKNHLAAEEILSLNSSDDLKVIILRISNLFGINCVSNLKNGIYGINKIIFDALQKTIKIPDNSLVRNFVPINYFIKLIPRLYLYNDKVLKINIGYKNSSLTKIARFIKKRVKYLNNVSVKIKINKKNIRKNYKYSSIYFKEKKEDKIFTRQIDNTIKFFTKIKLL